MSHKIGYKMFNTNVITLLFYKYVILTFSDFNNDNNITEQLTKQARLQGGSRSTHGPLPCQYFSNISY